VYIELATGAGAKAGDSQDADARREIDERRGAVLAVLRASGSEVLAEDAVDAAARLRKDGDNARALGLMKSISGIAGWRSPQKLELALAGLSLVPLDLARPARNNNANLRLLEEVLADPKAEPKPLVRKLIKDEAIERRVIGFIGHHFSERMHGDRDFGRVLLEGLAANPRSDEGKQAREKLVLEGMARSTKASKAGILEERAKIMMAAADMAAKAAAEEARRAKKAKGVRRKSKGKARSKR
jgi:hypothetical protein